MKPYFVLQQMKCFFLYYLLNLLRNYETDNKYLMISGGNVVTAKTVSTANLCYPSRKAVAHVLFFLLTD